MRLIFLLQWLLVSESVDIVVTQIEVFNSRGSDECLLSERSNAVVGEIHHGQVLMVIVAGEDGFGRKFTRYEVYNDYFK